MKTKYIYLSLAILGTLFLCSMPVFLVMETNYRIATVEHKTTWRHFEYVFFSLATFWACCAITGLVAYILSWRRGDINERPS